MIDPAKRYPMDTREHARKSCIQAALDCRYGHISEATYKDVIERLHERINELDKARNHETKTD